VYAELHAHSAYSFLDGASLPEELGIRASELGYEALALTDHDGVYGSLEFAHAAKRPAALVCWALLWSLRTSWSRWWFFQPSGRALRRSSARTVSVSGGPVKSLDEVRTL